MSATSFATRAALVAQYGIPVMPLLPRTKRAFLDHWQALATTNISQIDNWHARNPEFNCACVARAGEFWILDLDSPEVFQKIATDTGHRLNEIDTLIVKSSGAKRHFYFRHDAASEAMGNVNADDENGKELFSARCHDRYVVGPGSIHPTSGEPYEIVNQPAFGEIPVAPEWLINWITGFKSQPKALIDLGTIGMVAEGGRDNFLFENACKLRDLRYPRELVTVMLKGLNIHQCKPPMPDRIVEQKVDSAFSREPRQIEEAVAAEFHEIKIPDMNDSVLVGRLGEIYTKHMQSEFPLGWSWLALTTVAGVLIPMPEHVRKNLYSVLVGGVHTGKSQCIAWAVSALGVTEPILQRVMAGSAEGLLNRLRMAEGSSRLLSPDELGHLLSKSKIDNASFPYVLNRAYYETRFGVVVARGKEIEFDCDLSFIGGVVDDMFDGLFGAETVGGLYDRCAFAQCPSGFQYDYRPCSASNVLTSNAVRVTVAPDVWEAKREWTQAGLNPRVVEMGLRVAAICASIDGRRTLHAADLAPALAFVRYQESVRKILKPNTGENTDGKLASKFLGYVERYGGNGEWLDVRTMLRRTHAYDFGVGYERVLDALERIGEIEQVGRRGVKGQKHLVRRLDSVTIGV